MEDKKEKDQKVILLIVQTEHVSFLMFELQSFTYMLTELTCCSLPQQYIKSTKAVHVVLTSSAIRMMSACVTFSADPFSSAMPSSLRYLSNQKQGKMITMRKEFRSNSVDSFKHRILNQSEKVEFFSLLKTDGS